MFKKISCILLVIISLVLSSCNNAGSFDEFTISRYKDELNSISIYDGPNKSKLSTNIPDGLLSCLEQKALYEVEYDSNLASFYTLGYMKKSTLRNIRRNMDSSLYNVDLYSSEDNIIDGKYVKCYEALYGTDKSNDMIFIESNDSEFIYEIGNYQLVIVLSSKEYHLTNQINGNDDSKKSYPIFYNYFDCAVNDNKVTLGNMCDDYINLSGITIQKLNNNQRCHSNILLSNHTWFGGRQCLGKVVEYNGTECLEYQYINEIEKEELKDYIIGEDNNIVYIDLLKIVK